MPSESLRFDQVFARYYPDLVRYCLRFTREYAGAEDLAQEAIARAFRHRERFDPARPVWPWLRRIAVNAALDRAKRARREVLVPPGPALPGNGEIEHTENRLLLEEALEALAPRQRQAIWMRFVAGYDAGSAAEAMGLSKHAFAQLLFRARTSLREEWRRLTGDVLVGLGWLRGLIDRARRSVGRTAAVGREAVLAQASTLGVAIALVAMGHVASPTIAEATAPSADPRSPAVVRVHPLDPRAAEELRPPATAGAEGADATGNPQHAAGDAVVPSATEMLSGEAAPADDPGPVLLSGVDKGDPAPDEPPVSTQTSCTAAICQNLDPDDLKPGPPPHIKIDTGEIRDQAEELLPG